MSINSDLLTFVWSTDLNDDGVVDTDRYTTTTARNVPDIAEETGMRARPFARVQTLNGGAVLLQGGRSGYADQRSPGQIELSWRAADLTLLRILEEDYAAGRKVSVRLDHRWRQLLVTSSGAADLGVVVSPGYLRYNGDTYWLRASTAHTCGGSATVVYATPSAGLISLGSNTSVPAGSTQLAAITIAGNVVTVVTSPSGVANARTGYVTSLHIEPAGDNQTSASVTIMEV